MGKRIKIGISVGDINGIGLEVILKSLQDARMISNITPIIYASTKLVKFYLKRLGISDMALNSINKAEDANLKKINVLDVWQEDVYVNFGQQNEDGGKYALLSLKKAVEDLASTKFDALVTAPINKKNIQSEEFKFPGHTEYLANYSNEENPLMFMIYHNLKVGVVTGHIPLNEVAKNLTEEKILGKLEAMKKSLVQDFNISQPKIAVLGLNPHSGDDGLIGNEEKDLIAPTLEKAKQQGYLVFGPYPADGFFANKGYQKFDAVLAMYHDQGLTPFKTISQSEGINYTAGLPIVRTSPDHGTAYDIAGQNLADETSFSNAIYAACDIYIARQEYRSLISNQLEVKQGREKRRE